MAGLSKGVQPKAGVYESPAQASAAQGQGLQPTLRPSHRAVLQVLAAHVMLKIMGILEGLAAQVFRDQG